MTPTWAAAIERHDEAKRRWAWHREHWACHRYTGGRWLDVGHTDAAAADEHDELKQAVSDTLAAVRDAEAAAHV